MDTKPCAIDARWSEVTIMDHGHPKQLMRTLDSGSIHIHNHTHIKTHTFKTYLKKYESWFNILPSASLDPQKLAILRSLPPASYRFFSNPSIGGSKMLRVSYFFGGTKLLRVYMGVSLNGGTPNLHPKMIIFSRKTPWVCWGNPPF